MLHLILGCVNIYIAVLLVNAILQWSNHIIFYPIVSVFRYISFFYWLKKTALKQSMIDGIMFFSLLGLQSLRFYFSFISANPLGVFILASVALLHKFILFFLVISFCYILCLLFPFLSYLNKTYFECCLQFILPPPISFYTACYLLMILLFIQRTCIPLLMKIGFSILYDV